MKTYYDCIECFVRQAVDAARLFTDDEKIHDRILSKVIKQSSEMNFYLSPPEQGKIIHDIIREILKDGDPYSDIKERSNRFALKLYPELKKKIEQSSDPVEMAVRFAIAGNIIDMGASSHYDENSIRKTIDGALNKPLLAETIDAFRDAVEQASDILYLGDNAGEIVFDRLLLEQFPREKITFVVRGGPVLNDATRVDAQNAGLMNIVNVIDNGSNAPGTILGDCSSEFRELFNKADLIIAKGQGNYESLSDTNKNIVFLLMAKCPLIANDIGCEVGDMIVKTVFSGRMISQI
jgi:damage-control phosphatase, subfamily I